MSKFEKIRKFVGFTIGGIAVVILGWFMLGNSIKAGENKNRKEKNS
ncbi:MAG: hypothetical protein ACE5JT_00980 [Nitrosopumilaceae archaeon]